MDHSFEQSYLNTYRKILAFAQSEKVLISAWTQQWLLSIEYSVPWFTTTGNHITTAVSRPAIKFRPPLTISACISSTPENSKSPPKFRTKCSQSSTAKLNRAHASLSQRPQNPPIQTRGLTNVFVSRGPRSRRLQPVRGEGYEPVLGIEQSQCGTHHDPSQTHSQPLPAYRGHFVYAERKIDARSMVPPELYWGKECATVRNGWLLNMSPRCEKRVGW
jgi:hypothetical protein